MKTRTVYGPEIKAYALVLFSIGWPCGRISKSLKVPPSTVYSWVSLRAQKKRHEYRQKHKEEMSEYAKRWRAANREEIKIKQSKYFQNNKHKIMSNRRAKGLQATWRAKNREKLRLRQQIWRETNPRYSSDYAKTYPEKFRYYSAERRAAKHRATPPWLTDDHQQQIIALQAEATHLGQKTGVKYHIDHIYPIVGKRMLNNKYMHVACGLHVPWNLRVLPGPENCSKNCRMPDPAVDPPTAW